MVSKHVPVIVLVLASAACVLAGLQSPIDIKSDQAVITESLPPLRFKHYHSSQSTYYLANCGHGAQVTLKNWLHLPRVTGGPLDSLGGPFVLEQAHFHWGKEDGVGSEHYLDGLPFSMEVHLVHWNKKYSTYSEAADKEDGLSVIAFFIEGVDNYENHLFQPLINLIPLIKNDTDAKVESPADLLAWVVPSLESGGYFTYPGSLTTSPYSENVRWIVFDNPIVIGRSQIQAFREIKNEHHERLVSNKRDLQSDNGREVEYVPARL